MTEGTRTVRIALGQLASGTDISANLAAIAGFARQAADGGARILVLPEYATYEKKVLDASFPEVAEPLDGPICSELSRVARAHGIALVAGVVETSDESGRAYNTLVAFGPDGGRLAAYRKIHLFDAQGYAESTYIKPAPLAEPTFFDFDGVRFGLMTCYDLRFPELARSLSDAGAEVLLACAAWVPGRHKTNQWLSLTAARAIENGVYLAGACQAAPVSIGHSVLLDPMGAVIEELGLGPAFIVADIPLDAVTSVRNEFPVSRQRRLLRHRAN
jgi:deaminated glutathione amidase